MTLNQGNGLLRAANLLCRLQGMTLERLFSPLPGCHLNSDEDSKEGQEEPCFLEALLCPQRYWCSPSHVLITQCHSCQTEGRGGGERLRLAPRARQPGHAGSGSPFWVPDITGLPLMPVSHAEVTFRKVRKQPGGLWGNKLFVSQRESYKKAGVFQAPTVGSVKRCDSAEQARAAHMQCGVLGTVRSLVPNPPTPSLGQRPSMQT